MMSREQPQQDEVELENLAESELHRLKRQYRIMENDRVTYAEDAKNQLLNQRNLMEKLEHEKAELVLQIKAAKSPNNAKKDEVMAHDLQNLLEKRGEFVEQIHKEKQQISELQEQIIKLSKEVGGLKLKARTDCQMKEANAKHERHIAILENRLEVATKRFNLLVTDNSKLRNQIDDLLKERAQFNLLWMKLNGRLNSSKGVISDLIEQATITFNQRDEEINKMNALKERGIRDLKTHTLEMCELQRTIDNEMKLQEFLGVKGQFREMNDLNAKKEAEKEAKRVEMRNKIAMYNKILALVKQFTGEEEIDKLTAQFLKQEEENFALFSYVNELNDELEGLQTRVAQLRTAIDEARALNVQRGLKQAETLENIAKELQEQTDLADASENKLTECNDVIERLLRGIESLFQAIRCNNSPILRLLGDNTTVNMNNVMLYLDIIEKRISDMLNKLHWVDHAQKAELRVDEEKKPKLLVPRSPVSRPPSPVPFEFSSEDEGMSLSKYRKLTTEEKIIKAKEENDTDTSSLSDDLSDLSSDVEDKNEENEMLTVENDAVENDIVENSYSPDELCCIPLPNGQVQTQCDTKIIEANSESDVDSFGISPQKELSSSQISDKIDIKPSDELENYILASNIAKAHDHIIHTSQFSTSNDLDVNNIAEERTEIVNKLNSNEETAEIVNEFHSAEDVVEETVIIEEHNMSEERIDKNNTAGNGVVPGDGEQEDVIQNLLNNTQFAIGDAPSCENATDFQLKKSNSMAMEMEQVNEVIIPAENVHSNNAGQENSSLMQPSEHLYHISNNIEQAHSSHMHSEHLYEVSNAQQGHSSRTHPSEHLYHVSHDAQQAHSSHMHPSEHFYQATNTNDARGGQSNNELCQQNSVSDLNLAQLVLSLKEDIQQLTKKIERQENILDAVVHANEINLTPLFVQSFPEKYSLKLPFTRIEDFDEFNQGLARNTSFCNEFITSLCSYIDNNVTLSRNILLMLRKYMSKDLTMLYTASKSTGEKMVLKDTLFCKCMLQATKLTIRNGALPLEHEKAFMKNLGLVVSRVKGWPTHAEEKINNG